jgi:hypothetical protein
MRKLLRSKKYQGLCLSLRSVSLFNIGVWIFYFLEEGTGMELRGGRQAVSFVRRNVILVNNRY